MQYDRASLCYRATCGGQTLAAVAPVPEETRDEPACCWLSYPRQGGD